MRELEKPEAMQKLLNVADNYRCRNQVVGGVVGSGVLGLLGVVTGGPIGGVIGAALGAAAGSWAGAQKDRETAEAAEAAKASGETQS